MTRDDDFIGQIEGYLDEFEGITPMPDVVREVVRAQLPTTKQVGSRLGSMRYLTMNRPLQVALALVAVAAIALVGYQLVPRGNVGFEPSPSPSATPEPTPLAFSSFAEGAVTHDLRQGRYVLDGAFPLTIRFDIPAGGWVADWETAGRATAHRVGGNGTLSLEFFIVENVYADPCHVSAGPMSPALGPTVDDFVAAVTGAPGFETQNRQDVSVDGRSGTHFTLTNAIDVSKCDGDPFLEQWSHAGGGEDGGTSGTQSGFTERIWAVDVDGTRLVILFSTFGTEPGEDVVGEGQIIDSIRFE